MTALKLTINDNRKIHAIQKEFTEMFPYLKLEFFSKPHKPGGTSSRKQLRLNNKTIGECRTRHNEGSIIISSSMTVSELEQTFGELFGLSVQVFRRSGKIWLETTITDGWTLEEQNRQGESLTLQVNNRNGEAMAS